MIPQRLMAAAGGFFALILGLLLLYYLIPNFIPSFGAASGRTLGAADFPRFIAWALLVFGTLEVGLILVSGETLRWEPPEDVSRFLIVGAIILASLLIMPYLGMMQTGALMLVAMLMATAGLRLFHSVVIAVGFSALLYVLFVLVMGKPLPHGSLWS